MPESDLARPRRRMEALYQSSLTCVELKKRSNFYGIGGQMLEQKFGGQLGRNARGFADRVCGLPA